jgi:DNA-binding CsgD family transcriptional regulator
LIVQHPSAFFAHTSLSETNLKTSIYDTFVEEINKANTAAEFCVCLDNVAKELAFDCFFYYGCQNETITKKTEVTLSNYPKILKDKLFSAIQMESHTIFTACKSTGNMVGWSNVLEKDQIAGLKKSHPNGFAIGWGLVIMHSPSRIAYLELTRSNGELTMSEQLRKKDAFRAISHAFEDRLADLKRATDQDLAAINGGHNSPVCPLSKRELEILRWTADGKTAEEAGDILGISLRTINFHLTNIMQILAVSNKTAAVSLVQIRGWLH